MQREATNCCCLIQDGIEVCWSVLSALCTVDSKYLQKACVPGCADAYRQKHLWVTCTFQIPAMLFFFVALLQPLQQYSKQLNQVKVSYRRGNQSLERWGLVFVEWAKTPKCDKKVLYNLCFCLHTRCIRRENSLATLRSSINGSLCGGKRKVIVWRHFVFQLKNAKFITIVWVWLGCSYYY